MAHIAGDPDLFRFRSERRAGSRSVIRTIGGIAAPRSYTTGDQAESTSGGSGSGGGFGNLIGVVAGGTDGETPDVGDPDTGQRVAICGYCVCDSAIDIAGA